MSRLRLFFSEAGVVAATTLGAGIFALPYVFDRAGSAVGVFCLVLLGGIVVGVHSLYLRTLASVRGRYRLVGLSRAYLGSWAFGLGFFAVMGGLILALVVYLILGSELVRAMLPSLRGTSSILLFWCIGNLPLLLGVRRFATLELWATVAMGFLIGFIFFSARFSDVLPHLTVGHIENSLMPLGATLFALAGWTAVEPVYELEEMQRAPLREARGGMESKSPLAALALGTFAVAFLYLLFVFGVLSSAQTVAPDTISGLHNWPAWKLSLLGALGLFAVWTSYVPISREIKNSLEYDMKWKSSLALLITLFLPLLIVLSGLQSFSAAIGLAGGAFLSLQYLLIILVSEKVLQFKGARRALALLIGTPFVAAAVYEIYSFAVR